MNQGIKSIELLFDNGDIIIVDNMFLSHFYIANIDDNGDEIPYERILNTNTLYANFITLKVNPSINNVYNDNVISNIKRNNLFGINVNTSKDKIVKFSVASSIDPFEEDSTNVYDKSFISDNFLCMLISSFNIKYEESLFI